MANATAKTRGGNLKRNSDRRRATSFREHHAKQVSYGNHATPVSKHDDPLGASNANILLAIQNSY